MLNIRRKLGSLSPGEIQALKESERIAPYIRGAVDHHQGVKLECCPYADDEKKIRAWTRGWVISSLSSNENKEVGSCTM